MTPTSDTTSDLPTVLTTLEREFEKSDICVSFQRQLANPSSLAAVSKESRKESGNGVGKDSGKEEKKEAEKKDVTSARAEAEVKKEKDDVTEVKEEKEESEGWVPVTKGGKKGQGGKVKKENDDKVTGKVGGKEKVQHQPSIPPSPTLPGSSTPTASSFPPHNPVPTVTSTPTSFSRRDLRRFRGIVSSFDAALQQLRATLSTLLSGNPTLSTFNSAGGISRRHNNLPHILLDLCLTPLSLSPYGEGQGLYFVVETLGMAR